MVTKVFVTVTNQFLQWKKLCSRLSSSEVHFLIKIGRFAFLRPLWGT